MRVHELAKKLNLTSKELIAQIEKLGGEAKNHMAVVSEEILAKLEKSSKAPAEPKAAAKNTAVKSSSKSEAVSAPAAVAAKQPPKKQTQKTSPAPAAEAPKPKPQPSPAPLAATGRKKEPEKVTASSQGKPQAAVAEAPAPVAPAPPAPPAVRTLKIRFPITVGNLAKETSQSIPTLIKAFMSMGIFANVNQLLNEEIVMEVAKLLQLPIEAMEDEAEKLSVKGDSAEDAKFLKSRPPIVTIMGHVDHGKTSLLDAIRKTNVAGKEHGAITQHIGAYGVDIPGKGHVTFLDTPGHEAFTAMRARGAIVTDVVVLVVAADDGVMPQTIEAYDHAKEAGCPVVVAVNKVDLPQANIPKVLGELQKIGLASESWGGKTICVEVSAKTGKGITELLDMLLLESEVLELKANPSCLAAGTVIESHLSKTSGPVATAIVQKGTLKITDMVVCGPYMGRVRSLKNDLGKNMKEAGPSYAVEINGLNGVPEAGEHFYVVQDERTARAITEKKILEKREKDMRGANKRLSLEELYHRISSGNFKELKLIIKADVQGSMEALSQSLEKLTTDLCRIHVIHQGTGGINESDIMLAAASDAVILGFHVKVDPKAQEIGEKEGVDIRYYNIIYEAVEDVRKAMEGLLEPTYTEVQEGKIQLRKIFHSSKVGTIGGGQVIKGKVLRSNPIRVIRDQVVVYEGKLASLKRFKDDVREVTSGIECGLAIDGFNDLKEGDIIESFRIDKTATKL